MNARVCRVCALAALVSWAADGHAQTRTPRVEVAAAIGGTTSAGLGEEAARLETGTSGDFTLFQTTTDVTAHPRLQLSVGTPLGRHFALELDATWGRPRLRVQVERDVEAAALPVLEERFDELALGPALRVDLLSEGRRVRPFVLAGVDYVRSTHDDRRTIDSGWRLFVGGGGRWLAGRGGRLPRWGARADVRVERQHGGVAFEGISMTRAVASGGILVQF